VTETRHLIRKSQAGDKEARNLLVEKNIGLVRSIVNRFSSRSAEKEDLFQIGMIGLLKAIDYFDLNYDVRFSTYAVPMINGEIRRYLRDNDLVKVSRTIKDNRLVLLRVKEELTAHLGREPLLSELMNASGMEKEDLLLALNAGQEVESLHQTIYQGDGSSIRLMDKLAIKEDEGDMSLNRMMLADTLSALDSKERELIILRFYFDQTQSQIAKRLGVSQVQVSRLEKRILKKMKMLIS
jgi:RNA polymerase sporulation-specific sigma factor